MSSIALDLINQPAKGKRPEFFGNRAQEHLMSMTLALMQELAVTRERLDTLERLLEDRGIVSQHDVDSYIPDEKAATERQGKQQALISTVMRSMEQEVKAMQR